MLPGGGGMGGDGPGVDSVPKSTGLRSSYSKFDVYTLCPISDGISCANYDDAIL